MNHLPSISKAFSLIIQEENQRYEKSVKLVFDSTFAVKITHGNSKNLLQCSYCHILGHTKDKCYKLHGYPPGYGSKNWSSGSTGAKSNHSARANSVEVSEFRFNLLFISALISRYDISVVFCKSGYILQDLCRVIGKDSWHSELGHPSSWVLNLLKDTLRLKNRDKFTARALRIIFQGYPPGVKSYKVFVLQNQKIVKPRNVVVHEHVFPFQNVNVSHLFVDPFKDLSLPNVVIDLQEVAQQEGVLNLPSEQDGQVDVQQGFNESNSTQEACLFNEPQMEQVDTPTTIVPDISSHDIEESIPTADVSCVTQTAQVLPLWSSRDTYKSSYLQKSVVSLPEGEKTIDSVQDWYLLQLDVNNAFLNGLLDEEVYMKLLLKYKTQFKGSNMVCQVNKSIYGLKQASRQWFNAFSPVILELGFHQSPFEHSLFKGSGDEFVALLVYVDDIVFAGKNLKLLSDVQDFLQQHFKLKSLEDAGCLGVKPAESPMIHSLKLSANECVLLDDRQEYRRLVGRLLYLTNTRHDIVHTVHLLSQFVASPRLLHMVALNHLLANIKQSPRLGLLFSENSDMQLSAFVDSEYGLCADSRCSTTSFCTFFGNSLVSWKSKK
ncbi:hypothetical protein F3Y22_tig00110621pilonHSYRG00137 [Hibiscus syriacus]|uniref:Uncharacterized protein n=1 Tax=Hibiscus syriacus TaxID=106335 RepID=A0A6A3A043_HIBSY|nr:hypothetical protein F3Y22_tig00110621pilonHSYRG00137 [Hibiscus syriacus]